MKVYSSHTIVTIHIISPVCDSNFVMIYKMRFFKGDFIKKASFKKKKMSVISSE